MARILPSPDAFPGMRPDGWTGPTDADTPAWALDAEPDDKDYDVPPDAALTATITPGSKAADQGGAGSTNPFPGYPGTQPNGGAGSGGAYGHPADPALTQTTLASSVTPTPSSALGAVSGNTLGSIVGGMQQLPDPDTFPGGNQVQGATDTTGTTGPRRLRRDNSAGGTMP